MRKINQRGLELLKAWEGCRLEAYRDVGGIWTIGYGHTGSVQKGDTITAPLAEALLSAETHRISDQVDDRVPGYLSNNQFSALVCFTYNVGLRAFTNSTLLKRIIANDVPGAADQFMRWNKVNGVAVKGLTNRRAAERDLFLRPDDVT